MSGTIGLAWRSDIRMHTVSCIWNEACDGKYEMSPLQQQNNSRATPSPHYRRQSTTENTQQNNNKRRLK
jgi:hypothetical protein